MQSRSLQRGRERRSVTKAISLLTIPSAPPLQTDPALKRPDCQQMSPRAQQLFDGRDGGFGPRGGAGQGGYKGLLLQRWSGVTCLHPGGLTFGGLRTDCAAPSGTDEVCLLELTAARARVRGDTHALLCRNQLL